MAKKPETIFKEKVLKDLKAVKNCWFVKTDMVSVRGIPDVLCCIGGIFVALELKRSITAKIDALQTYMIKRIQKSGGIAFVVHPHNWEDILFQLKIRGSHDKLELPYIEEQ